MMRGLVVTVVLLLGALAATGMLAASLQQKATAGHHVDEDFLPGGEAIDRQGWRIEPKAVRSDDAANTAPAEKGSAEKGRADRGRSRLDPGGSDDDGQ